VTISLYDLFHTIVAASTGWGKSGFVNAVLAQLATCPEPVELVLIDQQDHGLTAFKQCDRLRYPLLRQPEEILGALHEVYLEATQQRSTLFAQYDADDLADYNRRADKYLPPIVVVVEEASALLTYKEIGAELKKHAWELRKFGVYQFLMLTSAKGTTIDTDHRQQFASKVQLHANEKGQARLLMDAPEAITFPPGRAMIDLPGQLPAIVQTPYIDKRELRALLCPASTPPPPPIPLSELAARLLSEAEKDQLFKQRVEAGLSRNAASLEVYGRRYAGDLVERGKRVLGER
jgi:DNA segregation ATPase FtsK/SpoIIIE-like protein